ncbi:hypothetical protein [Saccharothrix obliqua]|nr:hypothetical protein [Saccharothrix obliqua]MBW4717955.1 hypothetical protein [Saccharothrix obliqua]
MNAKPRPTRYVPPLAAKAGRVGVDTSGTSILGFTDTATWGYKRPKAR